MASGLFHRSRAIMNGETRKKEGHLIQVLQNGYLYEVVRSASKARLSRPNEDRPHHTLYTSYVSGLSKDLRRVRRKYSITAVFRAPSTHREKKLNRIKDKDPALRTTARPPAAVNKGTSGNNEVTGDTVEETLGSHTKR